jgi:hypothetical protein
MAAPAKTIHTFRPTADQDHGQQVRDERDRHIIRHDFDDRRRMNVSERLAEGRGFWRGAFVGLSIGAAGGIVASAGIANMWTPQILQTVQNSAVIAQTLAGVDAGHSVSNVHSDTPASTQFATPPAGPAGSSSR